MKKLICMLSDESKTWPRERANVPSTLQRLFAWYVNSAAGRIICAVANRLSCTRHARTYSPRARTASFSPNLRSTPTHVEVVKYSRISGSNCRSRAEYPVTSAVLPHGRATRNSSSAPTSRELRLRSVNGPDSWKAEAFSDIQSKNELVDR